MQIKFENLSAKNIANFYPPSALTEPNTAIVADKTNEYSQSFLQDIMQIDGVERCLVTSELLSIKYKNENFADVKSLVLAEIDDYLSEPEYSLIIPEKTNIRAVAEALADAFIRPTLNRDNGDIEISDINEEKIELKFTGHCAGCPYAQNTLQNVIVRIFKKYLPQLEIVLKE